MQDIYGNCYEGVNTNTAHAEYVMLVDEEFRQAVKFLRDRMGGNITMYMNKQLAVCQQVMVGKQFSL